MNFEQHLSYEEIIEKTKKTPYNLKVQTSRCSTNPHKTDSCWYRILNSEQWNLFTIQDAIPISPF